MNRPNLPFLAPLLFAAVLLAGCGTGVKPDSVNVSVANLRATHLNATDLSVAVTLRYTSESLNAFGFDSSSHKLFLNGTYVGKAVSSAPIGLPPLSTTTQEVPLIVENGGFLRQLLAAPGDVRYRLDTVLVAKSGEEETRFKNSFEGIVALHVK